MKKLIALGFLSLFIAFLRIWWILNERLLGIEMNHEDFSRWIHDDLQSVHEHLDEPLKNLEEYERVYAKLILHEKILSQNKKLNKRILRTSVFYGNKERIEIGDKVEITSQMAMCHEAGKAGIVKFIEGGFVVDTGTELIACWSECYELNRVVEELE